MKAPFRFGIFPTIYLFCALLTALCLFLYPTGPGFVLLPLLSFPWSLCMLNFAFLAPDFFNNHPAFGPAMMGLGCLFNFLVLRRCLRSSRS